MIKAAEEHRKDYAKIIIDAEVAMIQENTREMPIDEQETAPQAWLGSVVPEEYRLKCTEIMDEEIRIREQNNQ